MFWGMSSLDHPGLCRRVPRTSTSQPCGEAPVTRALAKRQRPRARVAVRLRALRAALLVGLDLSCGLNPSGCPFPIFCSSGTDVLDGPPTGRRAAAGELNYTLNWVGFDNFIRTHLDIPSARFSPSTQRESREGFHGARLDTRSSTTGETGDQNNNAAPDWLSVSPRSTDHPCSKDARPRAPNTSKPSRPLSPEAQTVGTPISTHDNHREFRSLRALQS